MSKHLRIRVDKETHARLAAEAAKQERPMQWLAVKYIEKGLQADFKNKPKK